MKLPPFIGPLHSSRWQGSQGRCLGLDIGYDSLRLAQLSTRRGRWHIDVVAEHRFPFAVCIDGRFTRFEVLSRTCRQLLHEHGIGARRVVMAVTAPDIVLMHVVLPASSGQQQRLAQVRSELAAHGVPLDATAIDYRLLGAMAGSPSDVEVQVMGTPVLLVEDRLALAEAMDLSVAALPAQGLCIAAFLQRQASDSALLHVGARQAWLSLHPDRWQPLQWTDDAKEHPADTSIRRLLEELARLLSPAPSSLDLTGDHPALETIAALIRKYAGIATGIACLPASIDRTGTSYLSARSARFHGALALAAAALT